MIDPKIPNRSAEPDAPKESPDAEPAEPLPPEEVEKMTGVPADTEELSDM